MTGLLGCKHIATLCRIENAFKVERSFVSQTNGISFSACSSSKEFWSIFEKSSATIRPVVAKYTMSISIYQMSQQY